MNAPFIPPRTQAELASPAPRGQRHEQMKVLVLPLLGNGLTAEAVFAQLRSMYDSDASDEEIRNIIDWAASKNPQPSGYTENSQRAAFADAGEAAASNGAAIDS